MRQDSQRITARQQVNIGAPSAQGRSYARPSEVVTPGAGGDLAALMQGVEAFQGSMTRKQNVEDAIMAKKVDEASKVAAGEDATPEVSQFAPAPDMPQGLDPAFRGRFVEGYKEGLAARIGAAAQDRVLADYEQNKQKPDFNPQLFLASWRQKELSGVEDPLVKAAIIKASDEAGRAVLGDYRRIELQRLNEQNRTTIGTLISANVTMDMDPRDALQNYAKVVLPQARKLGMSYADVHEMLAQRVVAMSTSAGGDPRLFDVLTSIPNPETGEPLVNADPKLAASVAAARQQAQNLFNARAERERQGGYADLILRYETDAKQGKVPTWEDFKAEALGEGKAFHDGKSAVAFFLNLQKDASRAGVLAHAVGEIRAGRAQFLDAEVRKQALGALEAPLVQNLTAAHQVWSQAAEGPDKERAFSALRGSLVQLKTLYAGSGEVSTKLKGFVNQALGEPLTKDGKPSGAFRLGAMVYETLGPGEREQYAEADTRTMYDTYRFLREQGANEDGAYARAWNRVSGPGKALVEQKDYKERAAKMAEDAAKEAARDGSLWGWVASKAGFNPDNISTNVTTVGLMHARRMAELYPEFAGDKDWIRQRIVEGVQANFVKDPGSGFMVQKPVGMGANDAAAALSLLHTRWSEQYRMEVEAGATLVPQQLRESTYQLLLRTPDGRVLPTGRTFDLRDAVMEGRMTDGTGAPTAAAVSLGTLETKAREGKLTYEDLQAHKEAIQVGRARGIISPALDRAIERANVNRLESLSAPSPLTNGAAFGRYDMARFDTNAKGYARSDTLTQVGKLIERGDHGMALTAMREGFVAKASPDPNPRAGKNIGFGYNLQSRSQAEVERDFKAAGIPVDRTGEILSGKLGITPEQGLRLLEVTRPRYAEQAKKAVGEQWDRLPTNVREVLTDVAYQVGSVDQFSRALAALRAGKYEDLSRLLRVNFNGKDGWQPDERGNQLRAHLLDSTVTFATGFRTASARPSTRLEALATK